MNRYLSQLVITTVVLTVFLIFCADIVADAQDVNFSHEPQLVFAVPKQVDVGQPFLVRLTSDQVLEDVVVYWLGKEVSPSISMWHDHYVALVMMGMDILNAEEGDEELVINATVNREKRILRRKIRFLERQYPIQKIALPEKMVTPPEEAYERIANDRKAVKKALGTVSPERHWVLPFDRPLSGPISSKYGLRRILNGKPKNPHRGLDISGEQGSLIRAPADGCVILVGNHYYAGNSLYLDHGNGVITMYFHMAEALVTEGQVIRRGQKIGLVGSTGRATGPHLHWGVSILGQLVDPEPLLMNEVDALLGQ